VGGVKEGDEREIELGGARLIPIDAFPKAHYTALGHIHKPQTISKSNNIFYSGSIMPYAFDETIEKSIIVADINIKGIQDFRRVPLTRYRPLIKLAADNVIQAQELLEEHSEKWALLELKIDKGLTDSDNKLLKAFPNLLRLQLVLPKAQRVLIKDKEQKTDRQIFSEYYKSIYQNEPKEELVKLFLEIMENGL
jgi:exonuclease SbcD